jgi:hypothetical protein
LVPPPPLCTHHAAPDERHTAGCTEMLAADLSELPANSVSWSKVCNVPAGSPLSSEGISLL